MEVGEEGDYHTYHYTVTTRMTPALWTGSDENHFNVSLIVMDKVTRQCPQTTIFEENGEPKWIRTEVLLLTSRPDALPIGQTGSCRMVETKARWLIQYTNNEHTNQTIDIHRHTN